MALTWSTSFDWDNAASEEYVDHPSDVVNMARGVDSFEDLSNNDPAPSAWNFADGSADTSTASDGSVSISQELDTTADVFSVSGIDEAPSEVTFAYKETSNSSGLTFRLDNPSGGRIISFGSANPQVGYNGASSGCLVSDPSPEYDEWRLFTVAFDWANDQCDVAWQDLTGSTTSASASNVSFAASSSSIGAVRGPDNGLNVWCGAGSADWRADEWVDEMWGVYSTSSITSATKSFGSSSEPDLESLSYTLNGESITVDVIGSPGGNTETKTVTLDGASSYPLNWSSTHTNFRIKLTMSTTSRDGSSLPTFSAVSLAQPVSLPTLDTLQPTNVRDT